MISNRFDVLLLQLSSKDCFESALTTAAKLLDMSRHKIRHFLLEPVLRESRSAARNGRWGECLLRRLECQNCICDAINGLLAKENSIARAVNRLFANERPLDRFQRAAAAICDDRP